ncbi:phage tail tip fiber protein [Pseudomonas putida]|uniref:phage tail protein n=1 Tax=Pseudomonas putida TaxID=303 RepID=UPI003B3B15C9
MQGIFAGLTGAAKVSGASSSEPSSQTVRSSKAPVRFILGRASTGGVLAWVQEEPGDQTGGEWLHIVYVLSEGAIAGVDEIYVDERPLSDLGENATSEVIINPGQVNAFLLSKCPDWRQEQIGRGLSFVRLSFKYDAEKFPSGIPDVRFVVRGRSDVYDPRNGAVGYSANTALLILWYLRNRCAIPDDEIIFDSFASSANVCDEPVFGPDGKISPRYFAGAVIGADEKRNTVLDNLLSACAGTLIRVGGRWSLQVGAYYGPADFTVNEDMVIGTVEGTTEVSNSDAINTMRGTFVDPAQAWAETDYPEVAIQDWITKDGGELAESQSFAYVTDAYLAQRLANISLRRRRSGGSLSVPLNFNGYNCRPGRAVKVDLPSLNILGEFMVTEWTMGAADACKVTLKPYEQAIFDDAVGQPYDPLGFINLPVGGLAAVTGLAWAPSGVAEVIQGVLSWTPPLQTVLSYTVTIRKGTEVVQSLKVGGEAASCNINGLTSGVYTMSVIAFGPGTRSGEATINVNVGGPPVPESCAFYASVDTITLVPANRQSSLNGGTYEYFYTTNPSAPIADAVYLGQGLTFTHTGLAFAKEYFYYVRSANAYGKSDFLFVPAATSSDPTQMLEVIAGRITESELGQELTDRIDLIDKEGPGSVNERLGEVRSDLNQQIVDVNNSLGQVQSELQQQIDSIADLADSMPYKPDQAYTAGQGTLGEDGKLYQAKVNVPAGNPPPNATYWTDIGQAVQTANGLAARVGTVETSITELNGEVDAQAQQIDGLRTSIDGKADASTVSSLSNRVTQNEQGLSSQGQALTGVQNSLNTTNQNVTAAQQAAQAAADAAGAKGKVLYQSTAPAVADRLAQNLWIDTTGNANTPKRWSGSAWVAVTDKVATDAAAAAASALSQVATKADASTVQALTNTVTQQGQDITAAGQAITSISTSLSQAGGENLLYNPSFDKASAASANVADGWYWRTQTAVAVVPSLLPSALGAGGKRQRLEVSGLIAGTGTHYVDFVPESAPADFRPPVYEGVVGTASIYIRGSSGLMVQIYMQYKDAAGVTIGTHGPVNVSTSPVESYNRIVLTGLAAPAGSVRVDILYRIRSAPGSSITAGFVDLDKAQYEHSPVVTGWRDNGQVNASAIAANATATTALTGRVGLTEQGLTSVSGSITELNNTIGDVGGENLFYNPTFNANGSGSDIADGWAMEGSAVSVDSRVTSWLNSGEKAIRVEVAGVGNAGPYKSVRPTGGTPDRRPKVAEGQTLTASVYLRGTAGLGFRFFLQWINAAGSSISAPNSLMLTVTPGGERVQYSGVAPAGAVSCYVYLRIYSATGAVTSGHVEMARPQFEYGTRATGWRDNGQVNAATTSAVSTAVDSLGSTVTQQGNSITSVSNRTTSLENSVNSTTNGLATKASASAVDALTNRVSAAEGVNTSQSSSITELNNNVGAIQDALGASGLDPAPNCLWQFDSTTEGWVASGATLAQGAGFVKITSTGSDPQLHSGTAATLSITGSLYSRVRARITRRAGAVTDWDGQLFYQTAGHGFSGSYRAIAANPNLAVGESAVVEWDMANLAAGGTDWVDSTITRLRLDMGATSGGAFDVDWVAVGRVAPSASSRAVESLTSTVTQQGDDLSAQAQQLTGLQTSVGNNSASIQQVANAQSTLNGKINASYSVKLQVTAGGQYVATGFGLGVENSGGVLQSTFAVMADRFAVLNPAGNGFISPFAIQNGQVFINDALISKLSVQNAIVGTTIASSTYSQFGEPLMTLNFNSGEIIMRNWSRQLTYTKINNDGIDVVVDGVRRVRMGVW